MTKIISGRAGTDGDTLKGIKVAHDAGIMAVELPFTHGVNMGIPKAKEVGKLVKALGMIMSIHAPYFINLASPEAEKRGASKKRILLTCERAHHIGAKYVIFHAAYYMKLDKEDCYEIVKEAIIEMQNFIKHKKWDVMLAPETTGKATQFGDLDELIKLSKETGCAVCIDFAHMLARTGKIDYDEVMPKVKKIKHKEAHFSGIEYTAKGERRHLITQNSEIEKLVKALNKYDINITIINESPDPLSDAIKTKKIIDKVLI